MFAQHSSSLCCQSAVSLFCWCWYCDGGGGGNWNSVTTTQIVSLALLLFFPFFPALFLLWRRPGSVADVCSTFTWSLVQSVFPGSISQPASQPVCKQTTFWQLFCLFQTRKPFCAVFHLLFVYLIVCATFIFYLQLYFADYSFQLPTPAGHLDLILTVKFVLTGSLLLKKKKILRTLPVSFTFAASSSLGKKLPRKNLD